MFYWMKRNAGDSETLDSISDMSKAEILRGIVTEKLATAAQEILAVVERTVAGYEEEASGFRQEIDRQRRQLEVLLQPQIKLERTTRIPDVDDHDVVVVTEEDDDEEEKHKQQPGVQEDTGSLGLMWYDDEEEGEDEEEQLSVRPVTNSRQRREDLKDPDYQIPSRSFSPRVRSDRRKPGRPRISETQNHVDLRIRILEDSQTDVLSKTVFQKYPLQELQCPLGLREADFLDLLRSTFPQLAADKPFDVFTTDRSRKLQPLRVETLTPEEIYSTVRSTGHSALYIRLKTQEELQSTDEELQPSQREDAADSQTGHTRLLSPRVQSDRRSAGMCRTSEPQNHVDLRIRILEDSQIHVLSASVFQKYPLQELQCPLGLREADFLDLLRSTFPQLAADKPFDIFTCDRNKRLQPLTVKTLTPEEIDSSIRSIGAGYSALYIRLKTGQDPQSSSSEDLHRPEREDDVTTDSPSSSMTADQTNTSMSLLSPRDLSEKRRRGRPRLGEEPSHHFVRVCMLEDSQSEVLSKNVLLKSPVQDLKCPRGLQEADFLDLLRSTFPQLAGEDKPFNVFKSDRSRRLQKLRVKTLTPEEIYRAMKSTGVEKTVLYIRLKTGEEEEKEEELNLLQRNDDATNESPKSDEADLRSSSPVQHTEGSSTSQQQEDMKTEEADNEAAESDAEVSDDDGDEDDWKPDPELRSPKTRKRRAERSGVEGKQAEKSKTPCKVCGVWYRLLGSLIKHAWKHTEEPQCVCGVCGEHFESVEELKQHLQTYQKIHECSYCGKSFFTITALNCHTTVHTGNRPFKCDVCHKTFAHMSSLSVHRWVHVEDKPHKCDVCLKAFGLKAQLRAHMKVHTGRDKYHCHICGKSVYDLRSLTRHKTTHSGERRYGCEVCGKRFKLAGTLKSHAKTHTVRDRPYLCHICCKTFLSNCGLTAHMRTHSDERPFVCITCSKGFLSNGELKVHMRVHTGEAPYGCSECGRFFKRQTHLNNHIRTHLGIKLFVCGVCGKACSRQEHLTVHMRTHNGERPYKCSLCDKAFTQSHCLKTHMKSHQEEENLLLSESTT